MAEAMIRVYADTSVFGGVYDEEFARASVAFFDAVSSGRMHLVTSAVVEGELAEAPERVRQHFHGMLAVMERAELSERELALRSAYIDAGIVARESAADALHVAIATVGACDVLVSWNCRHIVHFQKIPMYNEVNRAHGYPAIAIHTPLEVVDDADQDL